MHGHIDRSLLRDAPFLGSFEGILPLLCNTFLDDFTAFLFLSIDELLLSLFFEFGILCFSGFDALLSDPFQLFLSETFLFMQLSQEISGFLLFGLVELVDEIFTRTRRAGFAVDIVESQHSVIVLFLLHLSLEPQTG